MSRPRRLRLEATFYLVAARLAVAVLPYRLLTRVFELPARSPELAGPEREQACREVRAAIHHAHHWVPGSVCLPKAIAAQAMLRRRGIATTLHFGVATRPAAAFGSHAWVTDGDVGVTGLRASRHYTPVASYSGRRGAAAS